MKKKNITCIYSLDDSISLIFGDKIAIEQLIINIVFNAKDAIIERGKDLKDYNGSINISTISDENLVKLIIKDNGIGIREEYIQKIWSPFFTTKNRLEGTGIGLSISKKIIREHNADVHVSSGSKGTQFTISFPAIFE